jgi:hypothetical protein
MKNSLFSVPLADLSKREKIEIIFAPSYYVLEASYIDHFTRALTGNDFSFAYSTDEIQPVTLFTLPCGNPSSL